MVTEMLPVPPTGTSDETETTENSASGEAALAPPPLCAAALDAPVGALLDARAGALLRALALADAALGDAAPDDARADDAAADGAPLDDAPADGVAPDGAAPLDAFGAAPLGAVPPDALDAPADGVALRCVPADALDALLRAFLLVAPGVPPVVAAGDSVAGDASSVETGVGDRTLPLSLNSVAAPVSAAVGDSSDVDSAAGVLDSVVESSSVVFVVVSADDDESDSFELCSLADTTIAFEDSPLALTLMSVELFERSEKSDSAADVLFSVTFEMFALLESPVMKPATLPWITSRPTNKTASTERFIGDRPERRIQASQPLFLPMRFSF
jgi:hypothetical protein